MNWKTDLKLSDLAPTQRLEITCRQCGKSRTEQAAILRDRPGFEHAYIDEAEHRLTCDLRHCRGRVRIALIHQHKLEGFVGGLA